MTGGGACGDVDDGLVTDDGTGEGEDGCGDEFGAGAGEEGAGEDEVAEVRRKGIHGEVGQRFRLGGSGQDRDREEAEVGGRGEGGIGHGWTSRSIRTFDLITSVTEGAVLHQQYEAEIAPEIIGQH